MKFILTTLLLILSPMALAKNVDTNGALTFLSLSKGFSKYYALNFYHYDIFGAERKEFKGKTFNSGLVLTYFQTSVSYQYLPSVNLTLGHIFQKTNPTENDSQNENRIFEQVVFSQKTDKFSMTHRFRFEQRFIDAKDETEFKTRLRYQIGAKRPLRGIRLDPGEFYLNTYNEFYFSTTGERNALFSDDWFFVGLGFSTKNLGAFELGPLVQWSRINEEKDTRTNYTLQAGWILKF